MDILTPSSGEDLGPIDHLLGRNTTDTINSAEHWQAMIPPAPDFFRGESDSVEVSPPIWRYCPAGWDDQIIGMCFPEGTPVRMADGNERPIEGISVGDSVVTHATGSRRVVNTFRRSYSGDLVTIELSRFRFPIRSTADHPFAVRSGDGIRWVKAGDLRGDEEIILGSVSPSDSVTSIDLLDLIPGAYSDRDLIEGNPVSLARPKAARDYLLSSGLYDPEVERVRLPGVAYAGSVLRHVAVTESFAKLIGLYLAEGNTDVNGCRVTWALNASEITLAKEIAQLVRGCFGVDVIHSLAKDGQRTRYVRVNNKALAIAMSRLVPGNGGTKRVPGFIMSGDKQIQSALIAGWLAGDGHKKIKKGKDGYKAMVLGGVTISPDLARDIATLANCIGIRATVRPRAARERRRTAWDVSFTGEGARQLAPALAAIADAEGIRASKSDRFACRFGRTSPIRSIDRIAVVGLPVYDFEVEEDHSFVAGGIVVHNCVGKATKNGCATLIRIPKGATWDPARPDEIATPLKSVQLSGLYCYWNARNTHGRSGFGEGAVVAYSLDGLKKFGFVTDELYPDSEANQRAYSDGRPPTQAMREFGARHLIPEAYARRITSRQQLLDYLAQGFPVVDGVPIGNGWMRTAEDGRFSLGGRTVGGHATLKVGYDKKLNRIYTRNSWAGARWGMVTDSPEFADRSGGRNNVGYCPLDEYLDRYYSDRDLQSGSTDAFVLNDVPWDDRTPVEPKIKLLSHMEIFG